jgi:PadR family transcriptional regulator AphA
MSGYDIKGVLDSLDWLVGNPSYGSIYSTLHTLLDDGLVTVELVPNQDKPTRKVYSVIEAGRVALQEWAKQIDIRESSLKAFVMRLILADSFSRARLRAQLEQRRDQVANHRTVLQRARTTQSGDKDQGERLVRDFGLTMAESELAWLDSTLDRLHERSQRAEVGNGN